MSAVQLPSALLEKIDTERRRLQSAIAMLECVAVAFEEEADVDFSDAMLAISGIVDAAVTGLDSVELRRAAPTGKRKQQEEDDDD